MSLSESTGKVTIKRLFFLILLLSLCRLSFTQEIRVNCENEPLSRVLISLRTDYNLMFSFDDEYLSSFRVTSDSTFSSVNLALDFLLSGLPLKYENNNGVYVIYKIRETPKQKVKERRFIISGYVSDITNRETLPYAGIQINGAMTGSDVKGNFSSISSSDSIFKIRVSYIGYYILDTIVTAGTNYDFKLTPSVVGLQEIVVKGSGVEKTIQAGTSPGTIRMNHKIAYYLPGNGDNSVFNLLRLQPGILASGEQSADLIIWGSYEGQSQIIFDGFTIYGMKNFNDNISAVNPYMAKDIKVLKGGFGAEYGERVGGVVDITGTEGDKLNPSGQFCINNMTVNGKVSAPVNKNSSLLLAYRQTYYNLYNPINFSSSGYGRGRQGSGADYYLTPDYLFRDVNLKYSSNGEHSNFYISLYGGNDSFSYDFNQETTQKTILLSHEEKNLQLGATLFYGLRWKNGNTSNFISSFSSLNSSRLHIEDISRISGQQTSNSVYDDYHSNLNEINIRVVNNLDLSDKHRAETGAGVLFYNLRREETTLLISDQNRKQQLSVPYIYFQDNFSFSRKFNIRPGLRLDFNSLNSKVYFQPRLSASFNINEHLKLNTSAGMYRQFVAKNMIIETSGNYRLEWSICDGSEVAVLNSGSLASGITYNKNGFTFNAEGYYKTIAGITRYLETASSAESYKGDCRINGIDVFIKKDFRNQTVWLSYTLSKTMEYFSYFPDTEYKPAMQDQRHELKLAALTKYKAFHFSVNYVFGSGFPDPDLLPAVVDYASQYSRLDAALLYMISKRKIHVDAGISVLNVLNRENIRYSNYTRIPTDETTTINLYAEAVPFTPTIFLNIYF
jgi:hypothetical protein